MHETQLAPPDPPFPPLEVVDDPLPGLDPPSPEAPPALCVSGSEVDEAPPLAAVPVVDVSEVVVGEAVELPPIDESLGSK